MSRSEEGILNLSIRIAEKLLNAQLTSNRASLKPIVMEVFQKISASDKVVIRACLEDVDYLRSIANDIEQQFTSIQAVTVEEDASLQPGSFIFETDYGFIDARVPMKLSVVESVFKKAQYMDQE